MRHYLLAALLGAALVAGCGGGSSIIAANDPPGTKPLTDAFSVGRITIPPAPGAGTQTYTNEALRFSLQFPAEQFALFDPPQYVTVLGNRVFELVQRSLPEGELFRPNVGLITDPRFAGSVNIEAYADAAPPILSEFFEEFNLVARRSLVIDGRPAVILEHQSTWRAPDGTIVPFHRYTLYTVNAEDVILIFTFTAPRPVFETVRPVFDAIIQTIRLP